VKWHLETTLNNEYKLKIEGQEYGLKIEGQDYNIGALRWWEFVG
jgi:hypothetical protein